MIPQTSTELSEILNDPKNKTFLFYFTQVGCPACNEIKTFLSKIESSYSKKVCFVNLDTATFKDIAIANKIEYIPTLMFVKIVNKKVVWTGKRIVGAKKDEIINNLKKF